MALTRRTALSLLSVFAAALIPDALKAQEKEREWLATSGTGNTFKMPDPQPIWLDLDIKTFGGVRVFNDDETVTITGAEILAALKEEK